MATPLTYLDPKTVTAKKQTEAPRSRSRTGYGPKEPTSWMLQFDGKPVWHRVYVMIYSNAGSAYVLKGGGKVFLGGYEPSES